METKIDLSKLSDAQLLDWVNYSQPDKELREKVSLLRLATMDDSRRFYGYLRDVLLRGRRVVAFYPAIDDPSSVEGMTLVGSIDDGGLYIG